MPNIDDRLNDIDSAEERIEIRYPIPITENDGSELAKEETRSLNTDSKHMIYHRFKAHMAQEYEWCYLCLG